MANYTPILQQPGGTQGLNRSIYDYSGLNFYYNYDPGVTLSKNLSTTNCLAINYDNNLETDIIYLGSYLNNVYAIKTRLDAPSKTILWSYTLGGLAYNVSPSISKDGNYIYLGVNSSTNDKITILNASDGSVAATLSDGAVDFVNPIGGVFFDPDGYAYVVSGQNTTLKLNKFDKTFSQDDTLTPLWSITIPNGTSMFIYSMSFDDQYNDTGDYYNIYMSTLTKPGSDYYFQIHKIDSFDGSISSGNIEASGSSPTYAPYGIAFYRDPSTDIVTLYVSTREGLYAFDDTLAPIVGTNPHYISARGPSYSPPSIASDGTIYYKTTKSLFAITNAGGATGLTEKWRYNTLPEETDLGTGSQSYSRAAPLIDASGNIIVCSDVTGTANVHILTDQTDHAQLEDSTELVSGDYGINLTPSIGATSALYTSTHWDSNASTDDCDFFAYGSPGEPVTTTTTTTPSGTSSSTSSEDDLSTSTSESEEPVTTTTTSTPQPLSTVKTLIFKEISGGFEEQVGTDASNNTETKNTSFAYGLNFGTLAPQETSETLIIALQVPNCKAIGNLKLGLINAGNIPFTNSTFGISTSSELRNDITPDNYFQGINSNTSPSSSYNISINTLNNNNSYYVYLNVTLPINHTLETNLIKYAWFFDYEG